jgi:hypothetical protein
MRKCGSCGQPGHNRRTCPTASKKKETTIIEEEISTAEIRCDRNWNPITTKKKVVICRSCGEKDDHTAKNCPYKPLPEGADIGPKKMECGHFTWWHRNGECELCTNAIFRKHLDDEEKEAV